MKQTPKDVSLSEACLLNSTRNVLVGVSGGPDSLCLLDAMQRAGFSMVVAHFNHKLRPEADAEMSFIQQFCEERGLPCVIQTEDVAAYAAVQRISVEEAARLLRYQFLFSQAESYQAQAVAVGHTADDQAETILLHILRGSGMNGLKGMLPHWLPNAWSETIPLVRPLLNSWRWETIQYCHERSLPYVMDRTNQDPAYLRNRLRNEVIPYLERINPALKPALVRMAQAMQNDQKIVEYAVQQAWEGCLLEQDSQWVALDRALLAAEPMEMQIQILRRALANGRPGLRDVDFASVQRALHFLKHPPSSAQCDLFGGMHLLFEQDRLWVATWEADLPAMDWPAITRACLLPVPGEVNLAAGWVCQASLLEDPDEAYELAQSNPDPYQAYLDYEKIDALLEVRPRQAGDHFQPLGMEDGSQKVSDFMINKKMPRRARSAWPLVCSREIVAWIPGFALNQRLRVTRETQRVAWLRLSRSELF